MARIKPTDPAAAQGAIKTTLDGIQAKLGVIPNIFKTFAHSEGVLEFYTAGSGALAKTSLSPALREQIALTVAGANACDYCASAHTVIGKKSGVPDAELPLALEGKSVDAKTQAALGFARKLVDQKGNVTDAELQAVRAAGYSDAQVLEIVAVVAFNIFTNYFNHVADTDVDFPRVQAGQKKAA